MVNCRKVMKFVLRMKDDGGRRGMLQFSKDKEIETPCCMLFTKTASAPHLTKDVLARIKDLPSIINISAFSLFQHQEVVSQFRNVGEYCSMKESIVYSSIYDSSVTSPEGYNDRTSVAIWGRSGKQMVDVKSYMTFLEACQPDIFQALADGDTNQKSSKKRCRKAMERTLDYLDRILELKSKSEVLKNTGIIASIQGGYDLQQRLLSVKETVKRPVDGYSIDGFHNFGKDSDNFSIMDVDDLLKDIMIELPADSPRFFHGLMKPHDVLHAIRTGFDVFDSSYPYLVTERGSALVFMLDYQSDGDVVNTTEINLKEKRFIGDFNPILEGCSCYTCMTHSRAYINHLLNTSELLAGSLLMIHNFHHYFQFFKAIREAMDLGHFDIFHKRFMKVHPVI